MEGSKKALMHLNGYQKSTGKCKHPELVVVHDKNDIDPLHQQIKGWSYCARRYSDKVAKASVNASNSVQGVFTHIGYNHRKLYKKRAT